MAARKAISEITRSEDLIREFKIKLDSKSRHIVTAVHVEEDDALSFDKPLVTVKAIRKQKNSEGHMINVEEEKTFNFDTDAYKSAFLCKINVAIGQKLSPGWQVVGHYEVECTFRNLIENKVRKLAKTKSDLHFHSIPKRKLDNAIATYAKTLDPERILFLYDHTVFGSAKDGYLITDSGFYYHIGKDFQFRFNAVSGVRSEIIEVPSDDKVKKSKVVYISFADEQDDLRITDDYRGIHLDHLVDLIKTISELRDQGLTKEVDSFVIVEDMADEVKSLYLNALVWLAFSDDDQIDQREMLEIQILMTQLKCSSEIRRSVRNSMFEPEAVEIEDQLNNMLRATPTGSERALSFSLVKDAIRLHRATSQGPAQDRPGVRDLAGFLGVETEQLVFLEEACIEDEKILSGEMSDDQIVQSAKGLAAKASALGVPIAAIYLTGSVTGLSAAGITSGLAVLGLSGVLGLSSMVTGIGVVVIMGIGIYKGMQWFMNGEGRDKASRREIMLQEVLRIHQKTISDVAKEVADLAKELVEMAFDVQKQKKGLEKLNKRVAYFEKFVASQNKLCERESRFEHDLEDEISGRQEAE